MMRYRHEVFIRRIVPINAAWGFDRSVCGRPWASSPYANLECSRAHDGDCRGRAAGGLLERRGPRATVRSGSSCPTCADPLRRRAWGRLPASPGESLLQGWRFSAWRQRRQSAMQREVSCWGDDESWEFFHDEGRWRTGWDMRRSSDCNEPSSCHPVTIMGVGEFPYPWCTMNGHVGPGIESARWQPHPTRRRSARS
jgi:hypothetical protein